MAVATTSLRGHEYMYWDMQMQLMWHYNPRHGLAARDHYLSLFSRRKPREASRSQELIYEAPGVV